MSITDLCICEEPDLEEVEIATPAFDRHTGCYVDTGSKTIYMCHRCEGEFIAPLADMDELEYLGVDNIII